MQELKNENVLLLAKMENISKLNEDSLQQQEEVQQQQDELKQRLSVLNATNAKKRADEEKEILQSPLNETTKAYERLLRKQK